MSIEKQEILVTPGPAIAALAQRSPARGGTWCMGEPASGETQGQRDHLSAGRGDETDRRTVRPEARCDVDRETIIALQAEAIISTERAANLAAALQTSRMIGTAVGIVMARYGVTESGGFEILKKASQDGNRKLRALAEEVVMTGDVAMLPRP